MTDIRSRAVFRRCARAGSLPGLSLGVLALAIAGCSDGTSIGDELGTFPLSGQAINGPLVDAAIEVWSQDQQLLGTTSTDAEGRYTLDVDAPPPYRVTASGGTLNGQAYTGVLEAACPGTDACAVTPFSTAMVALMDDQGLSRDAAELALHDGLGVAADPFVDPEAAESFGLATAREALAQGHGLTDWVDDLLAWLESDAEGNPPPGLLPEEDDMPDLPPDGDQPTTPPEDDDGDVPDTGTDPGATPEPGDEPSPAPGDDPTPEPPVEPITYTVSTLVDHGGSIQPTEAEALAGEQLNFDLTADEGYRILGAEGCNGTLADDVYVTGPIEAPCTVTARFQRLHYTVTATAGTGGSISPTSQQVDHGQNATLTVSAASGHAVEEISGCGGTLEGSSFTTAPVTSDCSVNASFTLTLKPPVIENAEAGDATVTLEWAAADQATGYNLYWGTADDLHPDVAGSFSDLQEDVRSPHTVTGLENGVSYHFVLTSTLDGTESNPSESVSATPEGPPVARGLNDTGIDWCKDDDGQPIAPEGTPQEKADGCALAQEDVPGQDGMSGRDATARQDRIDGTNALGKLGAGTAGFDYSKLDADGTQLPAEAEDWSCVLDHRTGLVWEQKRSGFGPRNTTSTYTWYQPDDSRNGGDPGQQHGGRCQEDACNTYAYIQDVQRSGLCGRNDWRLPTRHELMSLRDSGRMSFPPIDEDYFANTATSRYWTATPDAADENAAWFIHFGSTSGSSSNPYIGTTGKHETLRIRAVAGEQQ